MEFEGTIKAIIYRSQETGFTVGLLDSEDGEISVVGKNPFFKVGDRVRLTGDLVFHDIYGEQVSFNKLEVLRPSTESEIINYLSSGIIPFIGKKTAKKIVERFGEDSIDLIEENPEILLEIKGIGEKRLPHIIRALEGEKLIRETLFFFQKYGISPNISLKLQKKYGNEAVALIKENPYRLVDEVHSIGFKKADEIALALGIEKDSDKRLEAGLRYNIKRSYQEGHTYIKMKKLIKETKRLLSLDLDLEEAIKNLSVKHQDIIIEPDHDDYNIYFRTYLLAENYCARKLVRLSEKIQVDEEALESALEELEDELDIVFAHKQKLAVINSFKNGVSVITGGPGTGKTTIINAIINLSSQIDLEVKLAAPTGRAAKRMTETTGHYAETIHRLLEFSFGDEDTGTGFKKDEDDPIKGDIIIIDESSMMDILLARSLLKAVSIGTKLVLVGDRDQLPSVGAGNVLSDIIDSGLVSVTSLDEIFRQSKDSMIVANAHKINRGKAPLLNEKDMDFYFLHRATEESIQNTIVELLSGRLTDYYGISSDEIQVLSPIKRGPAGVNILNKRLQEALNPPKDNKEERRQGDDIFRVGDKVMQVRNNYTASYKLIKEGKEIDTGQGIYNGDIGFIQAIEDGLVKVLFDNERLVEYEFMDLDELTLSYAMTIHKSQGSEFPALVMAMGALPPMLSSRNLLYTAVTRAKKLVVLVGEESNMKRMIANTDIRKRNSKLDEKIKILRSRYGKWDGVDLKDG